MSDQFQQPVDPLPTRDEVGVGDVARGLWARKLWILVPTLLVAGAAAAWVKGATPIFKSEARVIVERTETPFTRPEVERNQVAERQAIDEQTIASQVQILMSRDLARGVIRDLKLEENPEFDPVLAGVSLPRRLLALTGLTANPNGQTAEERVLDSFFRKLVAYPIGGSRVIAVEFQSQDRVLAADVANAVIDRYIETLAGSKQEATREAGRWLSGEIEELRRKVADAEGKVEAFRSQANLFSGPNNTTLNAQRLGEYNTQITLARTEQTQAEARANAIRELLKNGGIVEVSATLNSDLLRRLSEQLSTLRAQRAEIAQTLLDRHPRVRELSAQINEVDAQFRAEAMRLVRAAENDATLAAKRADEIAADLEKLKGETSQSSDQEVELRALEREARASRDLLEAYLGKYRETLARESSAAAPPDARIISRATPPSEPFFPKGVPTVLIAFLGSFFVSTGIVAASILHRAGSTPPSAPVMVTRVAIAPPAAPSAPARAPTMPAQQSQMVTPLGDGGPAPAHVVKDLASRLAATPSGYRIAFAGALPHALTLDVARALTVMGKRVVIVDATDRGLGATALTGLEGQQGLHDFAAGKARLPDILHRDPHSRVHLVPLGRPGATPITAMADKLTALLSMVASVYDQVIVELRADDLSMIAAPLAGSLDQVLLIDEEPDGGALRAALAAAGVAKVESLAPTALRSSLEPALSAA